MFRGPLLGGRPRPRMILAVALAMVTVWFLLFSGPGGNINIVPVKPDDSKGNANASPQVPADATAGDNQDKLQGNPQGAPGAVGEETKAPGSENPKPEWEMTVDEFKDWKDPQDPERKETILPGFEQDGTVRDPGSVGRLQHEKDMRREWRHAYVVTEDLPTSNLIFGNTLNTLDHQNDKRNATFESHLGEAIEVTFSPEKPVRYSPYPEYNSQKWIKGGHAPFVPCPGPKGDTPEDLLVFKGRPRHWPDAKFGGYDVLNMDGNICWERETRMGMYGLREQFKSVDGQLEPLDWEKVNWADLQSLCHNKNSRRYDNNKDPRNEYLEAYVETRPPVQGPEPENLHDAIADEQAGAPPKENAPAQKRDEVPPPAPTKVAHEFEVKQNRSTSTGFVTEGRTAVLLRSYTGKVYTENDKQNIRALVTELSLKSGGEYEVFLLVQVKDNSLRIFEDPAAYQSVLANNVPPEFRGMSVLWNDQQVWSIYTELKDENERSVHSAQWLSVQKFSEDHPQFDHIWNWEMDFRFTGHHYDLLEKMSGFAKKQPRKGLWERNERWYTPSFHGDYDTDFRKDIEKRYGNDIVWGPPKLPFINPVGPKPPVENPEDDNYEWGVGEEADVITVGPIFNPVHSNWIIQDHVWGYSDENHKSVDLPRRTTIVTQSRISRRLLKIMHVENLRGNHVASEMTPQTVALLHGFKAVFAPHPVFMNRDWDGKFLNKWFNPGPNGESGSYGSPMGWGRERRYQGTTWYYRAEPPNRLYNNWMGWKDTGVGGDLWENEHGRPCLPSIMLHHVKNTKLTPDDHKTTFDLAYG